MYTFVYAYPRQGICIYNIYICIYIYTYIYIYIYTRGGDIKGKRGFTQRGYKGCDGLVLLPREPVIPTISCVSICIYTYLRICMCICIYTLYTYIYICIYICMYTGS